MTAEELRLTLRMREVEVRLRELEVEAMHLRVKALESRCSCRSSSHSISFHVSTHNALVPPFIESEEHSYFNALECKAATLH